MGQNVGGCSIDASENRERGGALVGVVHTYVGQKS